MKNFIAIVGVIVIGTFLVFLYDCILGLADFAGRINPALTPWVFWILFIATVLSIGWCIAVAFVRPKPMLVYADPTPEEMLGFRKELVKRLRRNRFLKEEGIQIGSVESLEVGLVVLQAKADEEIRATAKRVFIGTAISQNGRLDSLVVLYLISRLVWRISKLYNQRPHYRELINLYANIAATSFLAGSIEEFGVEEYIQELMGPLVAGSAIGAVPGAEAIAGVVTTSILSGSTNSLLAMRCGIVARNYMSLNLDARGLMRRSATLEAAKMFVTISAETVTQVTKKLVKGSSGAIKSGTKKTVQGMGKTVTGAAGAVGSGAKNVGRGVKSSAKSVHQAASKGVSDTADKVKRSVHRAGENIKYDFAVMSGETEKVIGQVKEKFREARKNASEKIRTARSKVGKKKLHDLFSKKNSKEEGEV